MPKNWEKYWGVVANENEKINRNKILLTLGNLTIIPSALNSSIRDGNWDTKRFGNDSRKGLNFYANGLETFKDYLQKPIWDENVINERANYLYSKAVEIWSI